jgi:hypothetical protein
MGKRVGLIILAVIISVFLSTSLFAGEAVQVLINGKPLVSDVPPQIIDGRIMVPLRAVSESLNLPTNWNDSTRTATISSKPPGPTYDVPMPKIEGPDDFKEIIQGSLDLLKTKDITSYRWIAGNISKIEYRDNLNLPDRQNATAESIQYLNGTSLCIIYSGAFIQAQSDPKDYIFRFYVFTLAHEAAHGGFSSFGVDTSLPQEEEELMCDIIALRVAKNLGATESDYYFKETKARVNNGLKNE